MKTKTTFRAFIAAALILASCATSSPPVTKGGHKFAATGQTISASYDPSVSGLPGNVGDIVSVAGGATAWVKSGTGVTSWRAFPTPLPQDTTVDAGRLVKFYKTGTIDFLTNGSGGTSAFDMPVAAGKNVIMVLFRLVVVSVTGTATGSWVINIGNNGTFDNYTSGVSVAAANFNSTFTKPYSLNLASSNGSIVSIGSAPLTIDTTTALGGATVASGYVECGFIYVDQ